MYISKKKYIYQNICIYIKMYIYIYQIYIYVKDTAQSSQRNGAILFAAWHPVSNVGRIGHCRSTPSKRMSTEVSS